MTVERVAKALYAEEWSDKSSDPWEMAEADEKEAWRKSARAAIEAMNMTHAPDAWKAYEADFNAMSDEEIARETERSRQEVEEHEEWLEAVTSWEAAGKPRNSNEHR